MKNDMDIDLAKVNRRRKIALVCMIFIYILSAVIKIAFESKPIIACMITSCTVFIYLCLFLAEKKVML